MNEIGGIDGMRGLIVAQLAGGDLAQLVVDQRQHAIRAFGSPRLHAEQSVTSVR